MESQEFPDFPDCKLISTSESRGQHPAEQDSTIPTEEEAPQEEEQACCHQWQSQSGRHCVNGVNAAVHMRMVDIPWCVC